MYSLIGRGVSGITRFASVISSTTTTCCQQTRNVIIVKRRFTPRLHKKSAKPHKLTNKYFIYDLVENTDTVKQKNIDVILTSYVEGLGDYGDVVSVHPIYAYNYLLIPKLAEYPTPENLEKYCDVEERQKKRSYSSSTVASVMKFLSEKVVTVLMNKDIPWVIEPWHIRIAFRKEGILVPEEAIELPKLLIKGPDLGIENKYFNVIITINNKEKVSVLCRLHHLNVPEEEEFWLQPKEYIFPEETT